MVNQQIARIFDEMADLLEIKGENVFRIRAYRRAAQNVGSLPGDVARMTEEELLAVPGIGKDLAGKIRHFVETGKMDAYDELRNEVPAGLSRLLSIPGLGPRTARLLHDRLQVADIDALEHLAREHRLSGLPGIKDRTEQNILKGIEMLKRGRERSPIGRVLPTAQEILAELREKAPVRELAIAGSLRRWKETVNDIDILATSEEPEKVMKVFTRLSSVKEVLTHGPTKSSVVITEGIQVDLRVVEESCYGAALAYFTGSKSHNIRLREIAAKSGMKINEYGIFREKDDKKLGGAKEEDIYRILGISFIPPELREDTGEIEAAAEHRLPELLRLEDIRGDLHVHTKHSDGSHTLAELAEAARQRGYEYLAVTDHTKGLGVARGLNEEKILEELREIRAFNRSLKGFRVLMGAEVDVRSDGTLDLPDEVLSRLDIVVASIHSGFRQKGEHITRRIISAIRNPYVTVIAHPTGRLIGERDAYEIDMEEVLAAAKEAGKALEINAYPLRLDLNDSFTRRAKELRVPLMINTDTHVINQFDFMIYGVSIGRRGWLGREDVLNTLNTKNLLEWVKKSRG